MNAHTDIAAAAAGKLEVVTTVKRMREIGPAWNALWQRSDGLIFQNHDWVLAWWETLPDQDRYRLRIGLVWSGERLVAVAALAIFRRGAIRMLEWAARSYSDYCDILLDPDCPQDRISALWREMSRSGGFDLVFLNRLLPSAKARKFLDESKGITLRPNRRQEVSCRVTGKWESGSQWLAAQPKKTRQEYRRHLRILSEKGSVGFRTVSADEPIDALLARFSELKRQNLAATGRASLHFAEDSQILRDQAAAMTQAGIMHLFVLELDGKPIALSLNFVQQGAMMAYVTTYDADYSRGSPGDVLIMEYIQWSIDHGCSTVDFLCGGERFKNKFTTETVVLESVAAAATLKGAFVEAIDTMVHKAKGIRQRWARQPDRPVSP